MYFLVAPFGQDDLGILRSIFEMPCLRERAIFLDTQCSYHLSLGRFYFVLMISPFLDRMPVPIGQFISEHVYDNQLRSVHTITSPTCCSFIDCKQGEEKKVGNSWAVRLLITKLTTPQLMTKQNFDERRVVVSLARRYTAQKKSFRIITPYDAQRSIIEKALKVEKIPWEDRCFNVDAFQGIAMLSPTPLQSYPLTEIARQRGRSHYHFPCAVGKDWVLEGNATGECHVDSMQEEYGDLQQSEILEWRSIGVFGRHTGGAVGTARMGEPLDWILSLTVDCLSQ